MTPTFLAVLSVITNDASALPALRRHRMLNAGLLRVEGSSYPAKDQVPDKELSGASSREKDCVIHLEPPGLSGIR